MGEGREGRRWERGGGGQVRGHVCKRDKTSSFHFDWQAKGGLSKAPRDTTPLPPSLSVTAITLSLGHHSLCLSLSASIILSIIPFSFHHLLLYMLSTFVMYFPFCPDSSVPLVASFLVRIPPVVSYSLHNDFFPPLFVFTWEFLCSPKSCSFVCFVFSDFINTFLCESEGKSWFDTASVTCNNTVLTRVVSRDPVWQKRKNMSFQVVR